MGRGSRLFAGGLLLAALALRLGYIDQHGTSPFFDGPVVDARTFLDQAQAIAGGDLRGGPEPFWQAPLYIYLLAFVCWLMPGSYFVGIRLVHALLGALSCLLVYGLARRAFGEPAARIAGCGAALCGTFLYFEGELLAVPLEVFLDLLLLQLILAAQARGRRRDWGLAGVTAGLAALARPNILLFVALFCAWHLWRRRSVRDLAPFVGCTLLVILPVTVRNWAAEPGLVLVSGNGGVNFYIGNNADYERTVALRPGVEWEEMVLEPVRAGHVTAAAKSSYFLRKGLAWIASHPLDYLVLLARKTRDFWSGPEVKRNQDIYYARQHSWILGLLLWDRHLSVPFGLIAPLGLLGLGLSLRIRGDPTALLRIYVLGYTASVLLFFPAARYRMPLVPVLIVFAALAAWRLTSSLRRRSWPEAAARLGGPLAVLLVLCNLTSAAPTDEDAQLHFDLGEVYLRKGEYALSEAHSLRALELDGGIQLRPSQSGGGLLPPGPPRGERADGPGHLGGESPAGGHPCSAGQGPLGRGPAAAGPGRLAAGPGARSRLGNGQLRVRPPSVSPGPLRGGLGPLPAGPALPAAGLPAPLPTGAGPAPGRAGRGRPRLLSASPGPGAAA